MTDEKMIEAATSPYDKARAHVTFAAAVFDGDREAWMALCAEMFDRVNPSRTVEVNFVPKAPA